MCLLSSYIIINSVILEERKDSAMCYNHTNKIKTILIWLKFSCANDVEKLYWSSVLAWSDWLTCGVEIKWNLLLFSTMIILVGGAPLAHANTKNDKKERCVCEEEIKRTCGCFHGTCLAFILFFYELMHLDSFIILFLK